MLVLIPASVVALAACLRAWAATTRGAVSGGESADDTAAGRVLARLRAKRDSFGAITAQDVREEIADEVLDLYSMLQPLVVVFVGAPLVGALGSVAGMMAALRVSAAAGAVEPLAAAAERALIPSAWGVGVALAAFLMWAWLRARLAAREREDLEPAVQAGMADVVAPKQPFVRRREEDAS